MPDFATTLHYPARPVWVARGTCLTEDEPPFLERTRRVCRAGRCGLPLVLNGFSRADIVAAAMLAHRPGPPVLITDCTWSRGRTTAERLVSRLAVFVLRSRRVHYSVLSEAEARSFPHTWQVDPAQVTVTRWYHGLTDTQLSEPVRHDGPIFSGGRSMRDFRALLEVAARHDWPITLSAPINALPDIPVPHSVTAAELRPDSYHASMRDARLVVIPLQQTEDRGAGQSSYLTAMALGKLVLVTDTTAVREYIEDWVTGLLVPPNDPDALEARMQWALDPRNVTEVARIRDAAKEAARTRFGPDAHIAQVLAALDAAVASDDG